MINRKMIISSAAVWLFVLSAPAQTQKVVGPEPTLTATVAPMPSLPLGTAVKMKLENMLSTVSNKAGDAFAGRVTEDVIYNGVTVIPVGSSIQGHVTHVAHPRRIKGLPTLELHPDQVTTPNGDKYIMNAVVVDTEKTAGTKVNDEGEIKGPGIEKRDKLEMAIAAGAGAGAGALIGQGAKGALIGSVVGGAGAVIYWLTKRKSATLPAGTEIVMELSRPMTLNAASD